MVRRVSIFPGEGARVARADGHGDTAAGLPGSLRCFHGGTDCLRLASAKGARLPGRHGASFSQGALCEVLCKPWVARNGELFPKSAFKLDMAGETITCPAGKTMRFKPGATVEFEAEECDRCPLRTQCTTAEPGNGRTISIAENEARQQRPRELTKSPAGRERLRKRVKVEHQLAHVARRQGPRARYRGMRENVFDSRRVAASRNLESWQRHLESPPVEVG